MSIVQHGSVTGTYGIDLRREWFCFGLYCVSLMMECVHWTWRLDLAWIISSLAACVIAMTTITTAGDDGDNEDGGDSVEPQLRRFCWLVFIQIGETPTRIKSKRIEQRWTSMPIVHCYRQFPLSIAHCSANKQRRTLINSLCCFENLRSLNNIAPT